MACNPDTTITTKRACDRYVLPVSSSKPHHSTCHSCRRWKAKLSEGGGFSSTSLPVPFCTSVYSSDICSFDSFTIQSVRIKTSIFDHKCIGEDKAPRFRWTVTLFNLVSQARLVTPCSHRELLGILLCQLSGTVIYRCLLVFCPRFFPIFMFVLARSGLSAQLAPPYIACPFRSSNTTRFTHVPYLVLLTPMSTSRSPSWTGNGRRKPPSTWSAQRRHIV
jgi:hypothetical protein